MRTLVDQLRDKLGSGVVVLGRRRTATWALIVGVTKDLTVARAGGQSYRAGGAESWRQGWRAVLTWPRPAAKIPARWILRWAEVYDVVETLARILKPVVRY